MRLLFANTDHDIQVVAEAIKILKVIQKHTDNTFNFQEHLFGGVSSQVSRMQQLLTFSSVQ